MSALFLKLLNMSISAGWLVLAVVVLRLVLKKAPRAIVCLLWALVAVRLVFPFSLESALSLIPSADTVPEQILTTQTPSIQSGIGPVNDVINPILSETLAPAPGASVNPAQVWAFASAVIWIAGVAAMVIYTLVSYLRLRKRTAEGLETAPGVWLCDRIDTPFILGLFRPRICLPSAMDEGDTVWVLAHERAHLKRRDHWWKPLGFLLLTVYWFNPLMWLAYILLCRDIELACDEKVIRELGEDIKQPYSTALINCSVPRRMVSACPLAFGEAGVKGRIKSVLNYKKPAFWIILAALAACIAAGVCFLTDPVTDAPEVPPSPIFPSDGHDVTVSFVGISGTDFDLIWSNALNGSTGSDWEWMMHHCPVYKFDTAEELNRFKADFSGVFSFDTSQNDFPSFNEATTRYDESFFEENSLLLVYMYASTAGCRYRVQSMSCNGSSLLLQIQETVGIEDCPEDWLITIAVSDRMVENCTGFDALRITESGSDSNAPTDTGNNGSPLPQEKQTLSSRYDFDPAHPQDTLWWLQDSSLFPGYTYDAGKTIRENLMELERIMDG